jgi:hypothetical protein
MEYRSARSKAEAVARMYYLGNRVVEPLGPGSKEKKSAFVALGRFVDLDLIDVAGKHECGRLIAEHVGVDWDKSCMSAGDTVTLAGLNRIVDGVVTWHLHSGRRPARSLVRDLANLNPAPRWDDNPEDEDMPVDLTELEDNIADAVIELASPGPAPRGVDTSRAADLDRSAVAFEMGTWRNALAAVQGWLHLSGALDESNAEAFDRSLAEMLGLADTGAQPDELFGRLQERLDRAVSYKNAFVDDLENESEGSATLETASANWVAWWDDADDTEEAETGGPIMAQSDVWPISQFRQYAVDGDMDLNPSYQRGDVWPTADAQLLIESVLRGIPLPSIILLKYNTEDGDKYEIVDGKQRLTSILRFIGSHPRALATVKAKAEEWREEWGVDVDDTVNLFKANYPAYKTLWHKHDASRLTAKKEKELYFPFTLRVGDVAPLSEDLEQLRGRYYSDIRNIAIQVGTGKKKIRALFEETSDYKVPVIVYSEATSRQIHEVFSLYNKQGKHLNAEEIRNATFHELDFMRALLATSGDTDGVDRVAPFLVPVWDDLRSTGQALANPSGPYALPNAGYKRTKALSWVVAALLMEDPKTASRSTSAHINKLLERIRDNDGTKGTEVDPLRDKQRVTKVMMLLDKAMDAHQAIPPEAWAPSFRNARGGRWQELQLVASLVALAAAYAVRGDSLVDQLDALADEISEASATWKRPGKTQSREQWQFIGGVLREFLGLLDIDIDVADEAIRSQYGTSGVRGLANLESLPNWPAR